MPAQNTSPAGPAWTVTSQVERTVIGASGQPVDVVQVTYRLPDGTAGTVQVPAAGYSVDTVRAAITAAAQVRADVANLTG